MKAIGVAAALWALLTAGNAFAQESYPDKPLRILVGFVAGGPADIIARVVGDKLTEAWGKPVVIGRRGPRPPRLPGRRGIAVVVLVPTAEPLQDQINFDVTGSPSST